MIDMQVLRQGTRLRAGGLLGLVICGLLLGTARAEKYEFHHENVLGTSLQLCVECEQASTAGELESVALAEIARLSDVLSSYDQTSELSRVLATGHTPGIGTQTALVSDDLASVMLAAEQWRQRTAGAFDVRAAALTDLWKQAAASETVPTKLQLLQTLRQFAKTPYQIDGNTVTLSADSISLDALAKGYILDKVVQCLVADSRLEACLVNIGGDIRTGGSWRSSIAVTDPAHAVEGGSPLEILTVSSGVAVCTSGGYRRGFEVAGALHSHIIDPRSGLPVQGVASATVLAGNAMDADALATALSVMPSEQGLQLIESLPETECMMLMADGSRICSAGWTGEQHVRLVATEQEKAKSGLYVDFRLNRAKGGRYRRPYVAVWLEDKDGFPVKTSVLWLQTDQPGPRWHRDLTRWYRNNRMRKTVEKTKLIGSVSGATRGPGKYQAYFDGTDNQGKKLADGEYTLCLEVAREHGTYQIVRESIKLGTADVAKTKVKGNVEMQDISWHYQAPQESSVK